MSAYVVKTKALIDGTGSEPILGGMFRVEDEKIVAVGKELPTDGAEVIDLSEYTVMPGLIDCHTHLSIVPAEGNQLAQMRLPAGRNVLRSLPNIQKELESGVTTMRIMGEEHHIDVDIRRGIEEGLIVGPRLNISGHGIVASNGHGVGITTSDGEVEVRKNIRSNFAAGTDFVKMFMTGGMSSTRPPVDFCGFSREEVRAAVEEANRMRTYVAAHAHGGPGVDMCIEEGVRSIEHGALMTDEQIARAVEKDMWVVGTFSITFHPTGIEQTDFSNPAIKAKVLKGREKTAETFGKIFKAGMNYGLGTDSMHGLIAFEMECAVRFGATNMEAIKAVTGNAAKLLMMEDEVGTIENGKWADFIAVEGDPLADIRAMASVRKVFKGGKLVVNKVNA